MYHSDSRNDNGSVCHLLKVDYTSWSLVTCHNDTLTLGVLNILRAMVKRWFSGIPRNTCIACSGSDYDLTSFSLQLFLWGCVIKTSWEALTSKVFQTHFYLSCQLLKRPCKKNKREKFFSLGMWLNLTLGVVSDLDRDGISFNKVVLSIVLPAGFIAMCWAALHCQFEKLPEIYNFVTMLFLNVRITSMDVTWQVMVDYTSSNQLRKHNCVHLSNLCSLFLW